MDCICVYHRTDDGGDSGLNSGSSRRWGKAGNKRIYEVHTNRCTDKNKPMHDERRCEGASPEEPYYAGRKGASGGRVVCAGREVASDWGVVWHALVGALVGANPRVASALV